MKANHNIPPIYDENSEILILGSFPSVKSREGEFFYNHPQNRFWKVLAAVMNNPEPITIEEKKIFLHSNHIALWDVIKSCDIEGSSDSSIKNIIPNDISAILNNSKIERIFCNGNLSFELYNKYIRDEVNIEAVKLPSTSPANARFRLNNLIEKWKIIK